MPTYSGKFHYSSDPHREGPCQVTFTDETCTVTPATGTPISFDLGDVDIAEKHDWDLVLTLFTGRHLTLRQFGAAFERMAGEFIAAWRDRTLRCLLLEDLAPVGAYACSTAIAPAPPVPAEVRLFKTNIAIFPLAADAYQWRLAAVDDISFNADSYALALSSAGQRLVIARLAKKTDEFRGKLQEQYDALRQHSAEAMQQLFPFLDPDRLGQLLALMPEGRSVPLSKLASIHPKLVDAIEKQAVSERLRPYFDALRDASMKDSIMAGYKFIREDEEDEEDSEAAGEDDDKAPLFFWFFFPLVRADGRHSGIAAWEAATGSGRATYFFRTGQPGESAEHVQRAMERLTAGLALINFRREPVYMSEDAPKFRRYAIGVRKLPELRDLRTAYSGRALHTTIEGWSESMKKCGAG